MTEKHESDYLVTVRAQVMTRDESTEGWLPLAGGGLANVSIRKRAKLSPGAAGHEYIIYGQRISDQSIILSCAINRDLKYYKVMPTFHHWRAGKQRNGLTFQTAADARAFDKGILKAYNELIDGLTKLNPSMVCPPLAKYDSIGEDDVFMTLDLPVDSESLQKSHSSPEGSEKSRRSISDRGERYKDTTSTKSDTDKSDRADKPDKPTIHYISSENTCLQASPSSQTAIATATSAATATATSAATATATVTAATISSADPPTTIAPSENYSYVTLTAVHEYNYPVVDQPVAAQVLNARHESINALKKRNTLDSTQHSTLTINEQCSPMAAAILTRVPSVDIIQAKKNQRARCRYCHELFSEECNRRGMCAYAPDRFRSCIEGITGMCCARCMLYHCMSDAEGETPQHPCECTTESGCTKRWIGLALLSILVPCLWCYPPLRACHWLGVSCGICGGQHKPQD